MDDDEPREKTKPTDDVPGVIDDGALRALCFDLFGRPPRASEREGWIGKDVAAFVRDALADEAAWRHWLDEQLYYFMLIDRFRPVGTSLDELPSLLAERRISVRDALHRIALSTSFDLRNPGADTFVTVVMEQFCGIVVQRSTRELEIGKSAYDGNSGLFLGERASSQSDVVRIAATHEKAARHLVARELERLTGAEPDKRDVTRTAKAIHKAPMKYVEAFAGWFETEAYGARIERGKPLSNRAWIRAVFMDLGGEVPTREDTEALRSALDGLGDPAPLRSAVVRMLLEADGTRAPRSSQIDDPEAWTRDTFRRLLGRDPSRDELEAFSAVVRDAADGPEIVLYTLLTSEEYERA